MIKIKGLISNTIDLNILNVEFIHNFKDLDKFVKADIRIIVSFLDHAELFKLEKLNKNLKYIV